MRRAEAVVGILMLAVGAVWFLQGIRVLPGSVMTGSRFWEAMGALVGAAGIGLFLDGTRRPAR
jgi:hypothetical protein